MAISKDGSMYIHEAGNTAPPMTEVWAFVSRDKEGRENVCGALIGNLGTQPMMTGNPRILEAFKGKMREAREALAGAEQTIHLLKFSNREEVEF